MLPVCSLQQYQGLLIFKNPTHHIFANGFMEKYVCWTKHGEQGVTIEDNKEEDFDDHFPGNAGFGAFDDDILIEEPK